MASESLVSWPLASSQCLFLQCCLIGPHLVTSTGSWAFSIRSQQWGGSSKSCSVIVRVMFLHTVVISRAYLGDPGTESEFGVWEGAWWRESPPRPWCSPPPRHPPPREWAAWWPRCRSSSGRRSSVKKEMKRHIWSAQCPPCSLW